MGGNQGMGSEESREKEREEIKTFLICLNDQRLG